MARVREEAMKTIKFPGNVRPARDGVYKRLLHSGRWLFSKFENGVWYGASDCKEVANTVHWSSSYQELPWRGLKEKP